MASHPDLLTHPGAWPAILGGAAIGRQPGIAGRHSSAFSAIGAGAVGRGLGEAAPGAPPRPQSRSGRRRRAEAAMGSGSAFLLLLGLAGPAVTLAGYIEVRRGCGGWRLLGGLAGGRCGLRAAARFSSGGGGCGPGSPGRTRGGGGGAGYCLQVGRSGRGEKRG